MTSVRVWTLESNYNTETVKRLANKFTTDSQLGNLSIQIVSQKAFLKRKRKGKILSNPLRRATQSYLKKNNYVILFTDQDRPMSIHQQRQKTDSLINQIEQVASDRSFNGKVFHTRAVDELEAQLRRVTVAISDPKRAARIDYAEAKFRKLCASRGLDWDAMTELDRENFVDDLIHEDRECNT